MKGFVIRKKDDMLSERLSNKCVASGKKFGIHIEKFDGIYSDHVAINQCYLTYYSMEPSIVRVNTYFALGNNRDKSHCKIL